MRQDQVIWILNTLLRPHKPCRLELNLYKADIIEFQT